MSFRHGKSVSQIAGSMSFGTAGGGLDHDRRSRLDRRWPAVSKSVGCWRMSRVDDLLAQAAWSFIALIASGRATDWHRGGWDSHPLEIADWHGVLG